MDAPIESVSAGTLLALLDNHSDIDAASLSALACTSQTYKEAVDRLWPVRMSQYNGKRKREENTKIPHASMDEISEEMYFDINECCEYFSADLASRRLGIHFRFNTEDSNFQRNDAIMPVSLARSRYFLTTEDLGMLQSIKTARGETFYRFTDVLQAAMLHHGREGLFEKMAAVVNREDRKRRRISYRRREVADIREATHGPGELLTERFIQKYCAEYYRTGRGGLREVERRLIKHRMFSVNVSLRSGLPPAPTAPFIISAAE
jgi:hypothetical protein